MDNLQRVFDKWERKHNGSDFLASSKNNEITKNIIQEGREKWRKKYGDAPRPVLQRRRMRSQVPDGHAEKSITISNIASFKSSPLVKSTDFQSRRPFPNYSCKCTEKSRRELQVPEQSQMHVFNLLNIDRHLRKGSRLVRWTSHLSYIVRGRVYFSYVNIAPQILSSSRLSAAVKEKATSQCDDNDDGHGLSRRLWSRTRKVLDKMRARMSNFIMILSGWVLMKFFTRLLNRIQIHSGQMAQLKIVAEKDVPIVYLPTHRSHLDYILITFVLWLHNLRVPHIAAGDNLNLPLFSYLMRRQGAFFIRRQLDRHPGHKDVIYRALLHSYMEEVLKAGESLEFFLEGGRSRTGKSGQPKSGLLSVVVESCLEGNVDDVYIVPVSITYERITDGGFANEQMGRTKVKETFIGVICSLWKLFTSQYGSVRLDFSQPFSMRDYIRTSHEDQSVADNSDCDSPRIQEGLCLADNLRKGSFYIGPCVVENHRIFVQNVARHIVFNSINMTTMMCTNLIAFLLLTKHRQGATIRELIHSFRSLTYHVTKVYGHDVGFSGRDKDVVIYAVNMLGKHLVRSSDTAFSNETLVSPTLTFPAVFDLLYYSNAVAPLYALESIVGICALSLSNLTMAVIRSGDTQQSSSFDKQDLVHISLRLCRLLQDEFILVAPCMSLESAVYSTIDKFIQSELLEVEERTTYAGSTYHEIQWAQRFTRQHRWNVDSDDDEDGEEDESQFLKIKVEWSDCVENLMTYYHVVAPYIEAASLAVEHLVALGSESLTEDIFISDLQREAVTRCRGGTAICVEFAAMETLRNSVKALCRTKYAHVFNADSLRLIAQYDHGAATDERLADLSNFLSSLLT